jgi:serine O-acetyltransferase
MTVPDAAQGGVGDRSRPPAPMPSPDPDLDALVAAIADSYRGEPRTRHIDGLRRLPSRDAIIEAIALLRELLFPGYFGNQTMSDRQLAYHIGDLLIRIQALLEEQIGHAIRHQAVRRGEPGAPDPDTAPATTRAFLGAIPHLRAVLATDVQAAFDGDPAASDTDEIIFSYPGFFAIMVHRLAHELHRRRVPLIPRMMTEYAHSLTGVDIGAGAVTGEAFFIDHGTGVVIGETAVIGNRVKIYQGVTLGALSTRGGQGLRGRKRHPTLEDDVTVYSGASVLGGDTVIGRGAVISGNVFVTRSVPPFTRVTVRNPELQYKDQRPQEFTQDSSLDWVI